MGTGGAAGQLGGNVAAMIRSPPPVRPSLAVSHVSLCSPSLQTSIGTEYRVQTECGVLGSFLKALIIIP